MFAVSSGSSSPAPTNRTANRQSSSGGVSSPSTKPSSDPAADASSAPSTQSSSQVTSTPDEGLDEDEVLRNSVANMVMNDADADGDEPLPTVADIPESECFLTSMLELRQDILAEKHNRMFSFAYMQLNLGLRESRFDGHFSWFQVHWRSRPYFRPLTHTT